MRTPVILALLLASAPALARKGATATLPEPPPAWSVPADGAPVDGPWWDDLGQPDLASLIEEAIAANYDLRAATDRIRAADGLAWQQLGNLLPRLSFDYTFGGQNRSLAGARSATPEKLPDLAYDGTGNVTASLAVDPFGRSVLGYQAGRVDRLAAVQDKAELALIVAQRVAVAWTDAALAAEQATVLRTQIGANEQLLELVQRRFDRGEATAVEVLQQEQQLAAVRAQVPLVEAGRAIAAQQLAVLLGRPPGSPVPLPEGLPDQPAVPALGAPADLPDQRPDLRASALRLTSAWQRRMAAERAFLPTISGTFGLRGQYGNTYPLTIDLDDFASLQDRFGSVQQGRAYGWTIGAQISMPIFDFGRTFGALRSARATEAAAAHGLAQARLAAMQEVATARLQLDAQTARQALLRAQATAARTAFETSRERYAQGIGEYLSVLTALASQQASELSLLQSRRDALAADILLRDAVGGAWTEALAASGDPR